MMLLLLVVVVLLAILVPLLASVCAGAREFDDLGSDASFTRTPGNLDQAEDRVARDEEKWTDALVEGTAAELIDWEE